MGQGVGAEKTACHHGFQGFARAAARWSGHPFAFVLAAATIVVWACLGVVFHFSDTWQLVINTATTIITFLMVFLLQNTQNRDSEAMQLKLDELIRATHAAKNEMVNIEELSDLELETFKSRYRKLAEVTRKRRGEAAPETGETDQEKAVQPAREPQE